MTDETRIPTAKVVITIYDREVEVTGDNLAMLKNSTIKRIELMLKRAAKKAKRVVIAESRLAADKAKRDNSNPVDDTVITKPEEDKHKEDKPTLVTSLQKLGIKLNKSEEVDNA